MEMTFIQPAGPPMPAVTRILARYDRQQVEAFIEIAVAMLDTIDGDPDLEDDDPREEDDFREEDDPSGQCSEDEISCGPGHQGGLNWSFDRGPGCQISDEGIADYGGFAD